MHANQSTVGMAVVNIFLAVKTFCFLSFLVTMYARGYMRMQSHTVDNPVHANKFTTNGPMHLRELYKTISIVLMALVVA